MPSGVWINPVPTNCKQCNASFHGRAAQCYCSAKCRRKSAHWRAVKEPTKEKLLSAATIGTIAELVVCQDLLGKGLQVFRAVSPHASCDLIAFNEKGIWRVEVKQARVEACKTQAGVSRWLFSLKREKNPNADILALVAPQNYADAESASQAINILYVPHRLKTFVKSTEGFLFWLGGEAPPTPWRTLATSCPSGHEYTPENTYYTTGNGRICRACRNDYRRRHAQAAKARLRASTN